MRTKLEIPITIFETVESRIGNFVGFVDSVKTVDPENVSLLLDPSDSQFASFLL